MRTKKEITAESKLTHTHTAHSTQSTVASIKRATDIIVQNERKDEKKKKNFSLFLSRSLPCSGDLVHANRIALC